MTNLDTAILAGIADVAWIKDTNGRFVSINGAFASEFRVAASEVIGKSDYYVFPVQFAERLLAKDLEVIRDRRAASFLDCISRHDSLRRVEAVKSPLFAADGELVGILTVMALTDPAPPGPDASGPHDDHVHRS